MPTADRAAMTPGVNITFGVAVTPGVTVCARTRSTVNDYMLSVASRVISYFAEHLYVDSW